MQRKLILPTEVKVCATCSFWDGERKVDTEMRVVVVDEHCTGECLVRESGCASTQDVRGVDGRECAWECLAPDTSEGEVVAAQSGRATDIPVANDASVAVPPLSADRSS
ncbi:hypothetical protein HCX48_03425 [Rhodocyclus tenuis]|uniref:Uncharacterized protein n=2 Tax=Rhodocyclus TaxID=1064 RepID=A0A6L5JUK7_RHOTE|nr:hypothetical protein [Rhodocyclus gracilis]MQY50741.1 hypothetical protein [Rhodocyclus gracilis]MRD72745.1 hypothetical protein [Rhodocyclus gracilis]NJA88274.1 hypothetical protein [Rhodocyclus gracilis]